MKNLKIIFMAILLFGSLNIFSQGKDEQLALKEAVKSADSFLLALKLLDIAEGKEMLKGKTFKDDGTYPVITSYDVLFEKLFDTDVDSIKGFKRLVIVKGLSKSGTVIEIKYLLISYKDIEDNQWRIFSFRKSVDTNNEVNSAQSDIDNPGTGYQPRIQYRYRRLAYWQIMNGQINAALTNLKVAVKEANDSNDSEFKADNLLILKRIGLE